MPQVEKDNKQPELNEQSREYLLTDGSTGEKERKLQIYLPEKYYSDIQSHSNNNNSHYY